MATSLLISCGLNEHTLPPYIHISEESNVDGSFILSSVLGQRLRLPNSSTILVCLQHNFAHYTTAGMRLGYNLNMFLGKTLSVIDPATEMATDFPDSKWLSKDNRIVDVLMQDIRTQIGNSFGGKSNCTVIIDNFAILLNLGASHEELMKYGKELQALARESDCTLIARLSTCEVFDVVDNCFEHGSDLHIRVVRLKSGNFKEVDGRLAATRTSLDGKYGIVRNTKDILYKVNERNIKIFNPGEIGVRV